MVTSTTIKATPKMWEFLEKQREDKKRRQEEFQKKMKELYNKKK